jgi:guanylate kinase
MKYLFLIGGSGSGKSTLAKFLSEKHGDLFHNVIGTTTRQPRENETSKDYNFVSLYEYNSMLENDSFIGESRFLMAPTRYGYMKKQLSGTKYNCLVVSIEGFLNATKQLSSEDDAILLNIICDKPFVEREGRSALDEQKINIAILSTFKEKKDSLLINGNHIAYREINFNTLDGLYD